MTISRNQILPGGGSLARSDVEFLQGLAQIGLGSNPADAGVGLRAGHPPIQVLVVEVRKHDHLGFFREAEIFSK